MFNQGLLEFLKAIYYVEYKARLDAKWSIQNFNFLYELNNVKHEIIGEVKDDAWIINGVMKPDMADCQFIDITLTSFTNTLPINNLNLQIGQQQVIQVVYIDILANEIKPVKQKYTRLNERVYKYENVPNDFEAEIVVDDEGLVDFYPSLFERVY